MNALNLKYVLLIIFLITYGLLSIDNNKSKAQKAPKSYKSKGTEANAMLPQQSDTVNEETEGDDDPEISQMPPVQDADTQCEEEEIRNILYDEGFADRESFLSNEAGTVCNSSTQKESTHEVCNTLTEDKSTLIKHTDSDGETEENDNNDIEELDCANQEEEIVYWWPRNEYNYMLNKRAVLQTVCYNSSDEDDSSDDDSLSSALEDCLDIFREVQIKLKMKRNYSETKEEPADARPLDPNPNAESSAQNSGSDVSFTDLSLSSDDYNGEADEELSDDEYPTDESDCTDEEMSEDILEDLGPSDEDEDDICTPNDDDTETEDEAFSD